MYRRISIVLASVLILSLAVAGLALGRDAESAGSALAAQSEENVTLATARANVEIVQDGRAIVSARGNRILVDSVPPLGGPNEEINPMDMLLGSLGTCGAFIYEAAARDMDIPLHSLSVDVEADFAPAGMRDGAVNPRVRAFRAIVTADGPSMEQMEALADEWRVRCPIYTTLERAAPIEIVNRVEGASQAKIDVIASGLDNPRGIAIGPDGAVYVVEAGRGDDDDVDGDEDCGVASPIGPACVGLTGAVTRIADGTQERILTGLSSFATSDGAAAFGPYDIAFQGSDSAYITVGFCIFENDSCGRLITFDPESSDEWQTVADIQTFEVENNPDGVNAGESNPYGLLVMGERTIVTDAAGNTLLEITPDGEISVLNIFPKRDDMDSVPTAVVEGPDGALYVAELTGFPYPVGGAQIYRIEPGAEPEVYADGFTNIIDIAFAEDGSLFVLEIATNSLASGDLTGGLHRLDPNGQRELVLDEGLISPTALAIDADGVLYISNHGQSAGVGEVLRVQLDTP